MFYYILTRSSGLVIRVHGSEKKVSWLAERFPSYIFFASPKELE